jgi:hypothetical protein
VSERATAFFDRLARVNAADLGTLVLAPVDQSEHDDLLHRVDAAAAVAGRMDELDEAADRAHALIVAALRRATYQPTWFGPNWMASVGRAEDQARLIGAVEDAAMAAVVADLVPDEAAALAQPFELIATMAGTAPHPAAVAASNARRLAIWTGAMALVAIMAFVAVSELVWETYEAVTPSYLLN